MEALVAVGLAGNVVQFVQFSGQLVSLAKEIKQKGAPSSLVELRQVTQDLMQQTRVIVTRLKANTATLEQEEQHVLNVAIDCGKAGEEFVAYIDELIRESKPSSRLGSVQSSFKIKWHHSQIEAYISRLNKLQGSLTLATTLSLRTREAGSHREILEHLRSIEAGNDTSQQNDDAMTRTLSLLQDLVQQQSGPKLDMLQKQMDTCMEDIQKIRSTITETREREILRWLDFRQRTWRFEEIEEAHQRTFEWIFHKPHADTPWHDFGAYLSEATDSLPYFINGKAGSGKSTLMKYIVSHPQTKARLQKWAGKNDLASPHFFFWNIGNQLQKSHIGMLRSLLHSVLARYQDLIPAVFPSLYANTIPIDNDEPPSYIELKAAFERLKVRSASFLRICIFIDGIDEFAGDHRDMSTFLCFLASSTIKVVASSRPINACLNVFRHCPTLKLQDLTHDDMSVFIRDRLSSHPMMAELQDESPEKAATLKAEIQKKAEGVFLWVRLVTGLLLRGLDDGDSFEELLPKLRALPTDLRDLYIRMMEKMTPEYQMQASQMFQIFEWWRLSGHDEPLELLLLSSAMKETPIAVNLSPAWYTQHKKRDFEKDASRIRSRCCGLLELRNIPTSSIFWPPTPMVAYLHRSVAEFLTDPEVWKHILSLTNDSKFKPGTHIACGILSILKTSRPPLGEAKRLRKPRLSDRNSYVGNILDVAMYVCHLNVDIEDSFILQYMDAIDNVVATSQSSLIFRLDVLLSAQWSFRMDPTYAGSELQHLFKHLAFLTGAKLPSFAAHNGVLSYLKAVDRISKLADVESLVLFALSAWKRGMRPFSGQRETLQFLLQILDDRSELGIETRVREKTLWEFAVSVACYLSTEPHDNSEHSTETIVLRRDPFVSPFLSVSNSGVSSLSSFDGRHVLQHCDLYFGELGRDMPLEPHLTDHTSRGHKPTLGRAEIRKRKLEEQTPGTLDEEVTRDQHRKQKNLAGRFREPDEAFIGLPEERLLTARQDHDMPFFEPPVSTNQTSYSQDLQNAVDILRFFLSTTRKQTELLNKTINTPERLAFTPIVLLQKLLDRGRREKEKWALESEYQFLYQLVGLSEVC